MKSLISVFLMFFIGLTGKAQSRFDAGLLLGLNGANFIGEPHVMKNIFNAISDDSKILLGYNAGVFIEHPIKGNFSARIEIKYNLRGLKSEYYFKEGDYQFAVPYSIRLHCLEVPLILNYRIALKKRTHNFYAGFVPGRIASAIFYDSYYEENHKDKRFKKAEYGMTVGYLTLIGRQIYLNLSLSITGNSIYDNKNISIQSKVSSLTLEYHFK